MKDHEKECAYVDLTCPLCGGQAGSSFFQHVGKDCKAKVACQGPSDKLELSAVSSMAHHVCVAGRDLFFMSVPSREEGAWKISYVDLTSKASFTSPLLSVSLKFMLGRTAYTCTIPDCADLKTGLRNLHVAGALIPAACLRREVGKCEVLVEANFQQQQQPQRQQPGPGRISYVFV